MIIIAAKPDDPHAIAVARALQADHQCTPFIFDTSTYPGRVSLTSELGAGGDRHLLTTAEGHSIPLHEARAIWWRRPQPMVVDPSIEDEKARSFTYQECVSALYGALSCCKTLWVNDVGRDVAAEYKPLQLKVAAQLGMKTPETLITNEPRRVIDFWNAHDRKVIFKAFNQRGITMSTTRMLTEESLAMLDNVRHAPVIFQSFVPGVRDIRVTVVGTAVFATEFDIEGAKATDYRVELEQLPCRPHDLPDAVLDGVQRLMWTLGLEFGGIDFRLTPEGEYVFFEINTAGEFMYIESRTEQRISVAMAELLASGKPTYER